jgi:hypothetical protein
MLALAKTKLFAFSKTYCSPLQQSEFAIAPVPPAPVVVGIESVVVGIESVVVGIESVVVGIESVVVGIEIALTQHAIAPVLPDSVVVFVAVESDCDRVPPETALTEFVT